MRFLDRFKRASPGADNFTRHSAVQITGSIVQRTEELRRRYSYDPEAMALVQRAVGIVDTCAMINARTCASIPLRLYRKERASNVPRGTRAVPSIVRKSLARGTMGLKAANFADGGNMVEVMEHPALEFVRNPNPWYGANFEVARFYFAELTGNFYSIVTEDRGMGMMQWPGYPQYVQPVFSKENVIQGYYFGRDQTDVVPIAPEQVIHYKARMSRTNPNMGEGVLASQLPWADLLIKTIMHDNAFVDQGQRPDSMIAIDKDMTVTGEQIKTMYDGLEEWRIGGAKEGKPFIGQGMSWVPLGFMPKDLRTPEQLDRYEKQMWTAFGIPVSIRDGTDSTYAGALVSDAQYGKLTIRPRLVVDADHKTNLILPMFGLDPDDWCFVYDDPVPRDEQAEWTSKGAAVAQGLLTINEVRSEMGYDESDDPLAGRLLVNGQPLGFVPPSPSPLGGLFGGGAPSPPRAEPEPDPGPDDPTPPSGGSTPPEPPAPDDTKAVTPPAEQTATADAAAKGPAIVKAAMEGEGDRWKAVGCECHKDIEADPVGIVGDLQDRYGMEFLRQMDAILSEAQAETLRAYWDDDLPNLKPLRDAAEETLFTEIERIAGDAIRAEMTTAGALDDAFGLVPDKAAEFARGYSIQLADDVMGTTADIAQNAVRRGLEEGLSLREVQDAMEGVPAYRAEMIARTELSRAANGARYQEMESAESIEWVLSPGACPLCTALAGKGPMPPGEAFGNAGETLGGVTLKSTVFYPPAHPNDRCTVIANYAGA